MQRNRKGSGDKSNKDVSEGKLAETKFTKQPSKLVFGYLNLFSDAVVSLCSVLKT